MTAVTKEQILSSLRVVAAPVSGNIVSAGLVSDIVISEAGKVMFSVTVPAERAAELEPMRAAAEAAARMVPGVTGAMVVLTAEKKGGAGAAPQPMPPTRQPPRPAAAMPPPPHAHSHRHEPPARPRPGVPGVEAIIAVASGKGGVGKSTTAVNLALGLKANGLRVGLLDADIYGPSIPRLLHLTGRPETIGGKLLKPMDGYGLKVMSIGFLVEEETAMIWRGPMVISALTQMLREVQWGELDILVVDMPPGTGDAQLTMSQQVPLAGAVIVSTPQDLALIDARRGISMFNKVSVPVLGLVENMSFFVAPDTGKRYDIFGHGGARREADRLGVPFLGEVPLVMEIRETSDAGTPIVIAEPDGPHARVYREIAARVWERIGAERAAGSRAAPRIVIED
jgi:ATP-binding protein involved in chromosome partitioning